MLQKRFVRNSIIKTLSLKARALILLQLSVIALSFGPILSKIISQYRFTQAEFILNLSLLLIILIIYSFIWQYVLKQLPLSLAYACRSTCIVWSLFWSALIFGQSISTNNLIATILIVTGIFVITRD